MSKLPGRGLAAAVVMTMAATGIAVLPAGAADPTTGWTASVGSAGSVRYFDTAAGDNGSVILAGWDQRAAGGGGTETDGVVRKLDASGNEVWKRLIGDEGAADYIDAVDVGADGSIVVAGRTRGDIAGRSGGTDFDAFVAKLSSSGAVVWTAQFGANGVNNEDAAVGVVAAADGSVFVGAQLSVSDNPAVLRFDNAGNELWRYVYGEPGDIIQDMALGGDGSAYLVGVGSGGGFVISASLAGTMSSSTRVPGPTSLAVAAAPNGDIVVGGDSYLGRFGSFGIPSWTQTSLSVDVVDVDVEVDGSIVAFTLDTGGSSPTLRGFTDTGSPESWSEPLAAPNEGRVAATSDGGVVTSSIDDGYATVRLARFNGSSAGGSGSGGFTDVPAGAFYSEAVAWLKAEGITTGTSPTMYSPNDVVTRGQMAAFLHRLAGVPGGSSAHGFSDVPAGAFYSEAVAWLKAEGITTGTSATRYSPDDVVTRGQMAAFLHRLAGSPGGNPAHGFSDVSDATYYAEAVRWLKDQGVTTGTSATTYSPNDVVTRGQMAAFLHRMATASDWDYPGD